MPKRTTSLEEPDTLDEQPDESTVERPKGAVSDTAEKAQAKVEEVGRTVQGKIDENRGPAADKSQDVASTLHEKADSLPGGERSQTSPIAPRIKWRRPLNMYATMGFKT